MQLTVLLTPVAVYAATWLLKKVGSWSWLVSRRVTIRTFVAFLSAFGAVLLPVVNGESVDPVNVETFVMFTLNLVGAEGLYNLSKWTKK